MIRTDCHTPHHRMTRRRAMAIVLPLALIVAPLAAPADPAPAGRPMVPASRPGNPFAPAAPFRFAAVSEPAPPDFESIGAGLRRAGYVPAEARRPSGAPEYHVTVERPHLALRAGVWIDEAGRLVRIGSGMGDPIDVRSPAAAAWLRRLLEKNAEIGPVHFAYSAETKRVYLVIQLPLDGATPAAVAGALRMWLRTAEETRPLWAEDDAPTAGPAAGDSRNAVGGE